MPQMAPMLWMILFFLFTMIFIFFNILNYFNFLKIKNLNLKENTQKNKKLLTYNWKW